MCSGSGNLNSMGLAVAEATLQTTVGSIGPLASRVRTLERAVASNRQERDRLRSARAPLGDTIDDGLHVIARDARDAKQRWREKYQPDIAPVRSQLDERHRKLGVTQAELSDKRAELNAAYGWRARIFGTAKVDGLRREIAELEARAANEQKDVDESRSELRDKESALQQQLTAEEERERARSAEHRARWHELTSGIDKYGALADEAQAELTPLRERVGLIQFALNEARLCLQAARKNLEREARTPPASQRGSLDGGYDPRSDPGIGSGTPRTADAGRAAQGFDGGVPPTATARGGQPGTPQVALTPPPPPPPPGGVPGVGAIPYCMPNMGVVGYACIPPPSTARPPPQPLAGIPMPGTAGSPGQPRSSGGGPASGPPAAGAVAAPAAPPAAATGGQCDQPLCREMQQINCKSLGRAMGNCDAAGVPSCGRSDFTLAEVKAACFDNMLRRCNQGVAGGTGSSCVKPGADASCAVRAMRVCGCDPATQPQCRGKWN